MTNNIIEGLRELVKTIQTEGFKDDVFGFAFGDDDGKEFLQAWSYDLETVDLGDEFKKSHDLARHILSIAKTEYGNDCESVNSLVCDETDEEVFLSGKVLMVSYLNVE